MRERTTLISAGARARPECVRARALPAQAQESGAGGALFAVPSAGFARATLGEVRPPSNGSSDRVGQGPLGVPPSEESLGARAAISARAAITGMSGCGHTPVRRS